MKSKKYISFLLIPVGIFLLSLTMRVLLRPSQVAPITQDVNVAFVDSEDEQIIIEESITPAMTKIDSSTKDDNYDSAEISVKVGLSTDINKDYEVSIKINSNDDKDRKVYSIIKLTVADDKDNIEMYDSHGDKLEFNNLGEVRLSDLEYSLQDLNDRLTVKVLEEDDYAFTLSIYEVDTNQLVASTLVSLKLRSVSQSAYSLDDLLVYFNKNCIWGIN